MVILGDHEGSEVGRVAGGEHDGEQRPQVAQEPGRGRSGSLHLHRHAEQHDPDKPVDATEREFVTCIKIDVTYFTVCAIYTILIRARNCDLQYI